ncbi:hypothetical protein HXY32_07255 [Candidatus Bathyarchaeota archaeon]|nr:hypothetical protein [Candidatus Bathyarchaeota archaeon]
MSETLKLSSKEVKSRLEKETSTIFIPVHSRAQKLVDEMRRALENLIDASKMLLENSQKEIEKRNMKTYGRARALNKLARMFLDRMRQIKVPDNVTYDSFNSFVQETQRALMVTEVDVRNWFSRISPFFIIDRRRFLTVFEKSKELLKDMTSFLTKEYVKTKTLEETFQLIDRLRSLKEQQTTLKEQKLKAENEKARVEKEIAETQQKMAELKNKGAVSQLNQTNMEIDALSKEVKHALQHLWKPFIKLQALSLHGGGSGLTQEEVKKLGQYLENPFEALASEEPSYSLLRQILQKASRLMADKKLKLKPDKMRKAEQVINQILNENSLTNLQQKCVEAITRERQLSTSAEVTETKSDLSRLQEFTKKLEIRKTSIESEENTIKQAYDDTSAKIQTHKSQIEKNILSFMNRKVLIE